MSKTINKITNQKQPGLLKRAHAWLRSVAKRLIILAVTIVLVFALYCCVCAPKRYDLKVGSISHETINATKDVTDEVTTEERRAAAANAVEPSYTFQEGVKEEVLSALNGVFNELRTVQQYGLTLLDENGKPKATISDNETDYALSLVSAISLTRYQIATLLRTTSEKYEEMVNTVSIAVENSLNTTIREGQISQSIQTILQIVGYKLDVSLTQNIVPSVLRFCIKPNMVIEKEATDAARQKAMENVEPIVYLQGQNIIREGDKVTKSQLEMLRSLGLLKNNTIDLSVYAGALITVLVSMTCLVIMLRLITKGIISDIRRFSVVMIVTLLDVLFSVIAQGFFSAYLVPVTFGPILLTVLLGPEAGIACTIPLAILNAGLSAGSNTTYTYEMIMLLLMCLSGSVITVRFLKWHPHRIRVLLAGLISAVINFIIIFTVKLMTSAETLSLISTGLLAMGGGLLGGVLALALQPVLETLFRLPTPSKLLELANPNQPLLRRLLIEAPGTYHHSIIVANLAEAAAEKIHANPYLARTAAYYHDIGKLKRPGYFKENQMGENPHDHTDPYVSAAILTSHTRDGVLLAQKYHIAPEIQDIIAQHHGDTPVMFFYHKALQLSNGSAIDINDFRYTGPRPKTKEAAIVMLADTIEAAVRSMPDPTPRAIDNFIERLVRGKLEDGQLSDCMLSFRDIDGICEAFSSVLKGVFHERIEYPEVKHHLPVQNDIQSPNSDPAPSENKENVANEQNENSHDISPAEERNSSEKISATDADDSTFEQMTAPQTQSEEI